MTGLNGTDGTPGADGADGSSLEVEYSVDGSTSWHSTFTSGDIYMHQRLSGSGTWSIAIRIVGEKGDKGDKGDTGDTGPVFTLTLVPSTGNPIDQPSGSGSPAPFYKWSGASYDLDWSATNLPTTPT